mmetsp:Transcript_18639/g.21363  ORF Transcript_18639/g.21363 Transcript_18639/m.21363 type:complete len:110 (-) Transcript_18639:722-1051(-)
MHSATMVTARLSEDETDIYAKHLDTSDEYDEGYDGGNDRSFEKHSNVVPMMICTKFMTKVSALKSIRRKKMTINHTAPPTTLAPINNVEKKNDPNYYGWPLPLSLESCW